MSISDNYQPNVSIGNGVTTTYTGSWSPLVASYMKVALQLISTGVSAAPLSQGGGAGEYTLSFTSAGYSVTLGTAPSSLYNVIRYREVAIDQTTPYTTAKGFQGLVTENSFDKITAVAQDLRDDVDRAIAFQVGSSSTATLPEPVADNFLGWNAAGTNLENKTVVDVSAITLGTGVQTFLATPSSANLRAAVTDETGSGLLVFATSPVLTTPNIGTPSAGVLTSCTGTATGLTAGITNALKSATTTVDVSAATAPTSGQVLTASSGTVATWATPSAASLSAITNSLSGDVTLTTQNTYYTGPTVAQGSTGTWFASGTVTIYPAVSGDVVYAKLWDGTTVIASVGFKMQANADPHPFSLSGYLASPAGNLRISVTNSSNNGGTIKANGSGNSKDSTISAFRVA